MTNKRNVVVSRDFGQHRTSRHRSKNSSPRGNAAPPVSARERVRLLGTAAEISEAKHYSYRPTYTSCNEPCRGRQFLETCLEHKPKRFCSPFRRKGGAHERGENQPTSVTTRIGGEPVADSETVQRSELFVFARHRHWKARSNSFLEYMRTSSTSSSQQCKPNCCPLCSLVTAERVLSSSRRIIPNLDICFSAEIMSLAAFHPRHTSPTIPWAFSAGCCLQK